LYICTQITIKNKQNESRNNKNAKRLKFQKNIKKKRDVWHFQLVKVVIDFYGKLIEDVLDTKILQDGRQIVTNGNGYIKAGYEI
jgi:hypothetical protein